MAAAYRRQEQDDTVDAEADMLLYRARLDELKVEHEKGVHYGAPKAIFEAGILLEDLNPRHFEALILVALYHPNKCLTLAQAAERMKISSAEVYKFADKAIEFIDSAMDLEPHEKIYARRCIDKKALEAGLVDKTREGLKRKRKSKVKQPAKLVELEVAGPDDAVPVAAVERVVVRSSSAPSKVSAHLRTAYKDHFAWVEPGARSLLMALCRCGEEMTAGLVDAVVNPDFYKPEFAAAILENVPKIELVRKKLKANKAIQVLKMALERNITHPLEEPLFSEDEKAAIDALSLYEIDEKTLMALSELDIQRKSSTEISSLPYVLEKQPVARPLLNRDGVVEKEGGLLSKAQKIGDTFEVAVNNIDISAMQLTVLSALYFRAKPNRETIQQLSVYFGNAVEDVEGLHVRAVQAMGFTQAELEDLSREDEVQGKPTKSKKPSRLREEMKRKKAAKQARRQQRIKGHRAPSLDSSQPYDPFADMAQRVPAPKPKSPYFVIKI